MDLVRLASVGLSLLVAASCAKHDAAAEQGWRRTTVTDRMRGSTTTVSSLQSINTAIFQFPYDGGARLAINVAQPSTGSAPQVSVQIDRGQFQCRGQVCDLFFRFGSEPVSMYVFDRSSDGRSDLLISRESARLLQALQSSTEFVVEASFYQEGARQFSFEAATRLP